MPFTTLGTSRELQPVAIPVHAPATPFEETNDPSGTVPSTPVNVVAPAVIPTAPATGRFTVARTCLLVPLTGLSRYHISTRRVGPASLCAPMKVSAVPL